MQIIMHFHVIFREPLAFCYLHPFCIQTSFLGKVILCLHGFHSAANDKFDTLTQQA